MVFKENKNNNNNKMNKKRYATIEENHFNIYTVVATTFQHVA